MTQSLLQGKLFFCREWAFAKIQHCLDNRPASKTCGAIIMGGPGSGKSAICCETVWPTCTHGRQWTLSKRVIAYHFCQAHSSETLSLTQFINSLITQFGCSEFIPNYTEKLLDPEVQSVLENAELERNPDEAFKRAILFPLLEVEPPKQTYVLLVDSIDESYHQMHSERTNSSRTIAELLANHHQLFPQWLLLVCSARKQSKFVTKLFTGFRKISLDDLRKAHVVRDVQQYILSRLDQEEALRQHLSRETAEMLNQLHIKSNGCFLYLEKVLDGVAENFIMLREIREIPGTLNGLYLWLCQRLFAKKQFAKVQPILNIILAARRPVKVDDLYLCVCVKHQNLSYEDFQKRLLMLRKILIEGKDVTKILFHHSFAEWLLDVKHCTQKYLCNATDGHSMLALGYTLKGPALSGVEVQDFALHLSKMNLQKPLEPFHLPLWMIYSGAPLEQLLHSSAPRDQKVAKLLQDSTTNVCTGTRNEEQKFENGERQEDSVTVVDVKDYTSELDMLASLYVVDAKQRTLLHNAAYEGDVRLISLLLSKHVELESEDKNGGTALNLAARQGHVEVVRLLLKGEADVNHADNEGWTPLRSAAWGGHIEVVAALLEHGVKVDLPDMEKRTALRAAAWGGHEEIVCKLLEFGACVNELDNEGRTALIAAAYMGHGEIVEHLLDNGAEINHEDADGRTALSVAALCVPASEGHEGVVNILLERGAKVDHKDKEGMTPLLVAAFEGHHDVCEMLLEYDADVDHTDNNNRTPLFAAASMGHADIVNLLLFFGAAIDSIDSDGRTVLSIAAAQGTVDVVRQLLDRGLDEMHRDNAGWSPLHYAAFEGHKEVCDVLMESGARVNETDNDGKHALILAAQEGHLPAVQTLLKNGAHIDHRSHDGKTAFRMAALENHKDMLSCLISNGADINYNDADGRCTLYILALENKVAMASLLIDSDANVDNTDIEGRTPLHVAAWQGHYEVTELLVNAGASINATDRDNRTALQSASWQGHVRIVRFLLEHGANIDHTCNQGATALCIAAQEGHEEVVRVLLEHNADPNHADQFGRSPIRVAAKCSHTNVVRLLEDFCGSSGSSRTSASGHSGHPSFPGSRSTTSMASSSTAETKPCSAILCPPPGPNSPALSPECAYDKRRSFISNPSSSKSSSNLTNSTNKSSQHSYNGPVDVSGVAPTGLVALGAGLTYGPSLNLSFTQQLQQCTRHRQRPLSRLLSPLSEPQSPTNTPPQSPMSDVQSIKLYPSAPVSSPTSGSTTVTVLQQSTNLIQRPSETGVRRGWLAPATTPTSLFGKDNNQRRVAHPVVEPPRSASKINSPSSDCKPRRNGIVTNPNFKVSLNQVSCKTQDSHSPVVNGNQYHIQVAYKQQLRSLVNTPRSRPNGLPLKKETPL